MSSCSREDSPDWLRSFQGPTQSAVALSSGSEFPLSDDDDDNMNLSQLFGKQVTESSHKIRKNEDGEESPVSKSSKVKAKSPSKINKAEQTPGRKRKRDNLCVQEEERADRQAVKAKASKKLITSHEPNHSVWTLSSDSDSYPDSRLGSTDIVLFASDRAQHVKVEKVETAIPDDLGESQSNETSTAKPNEKQLKKRDEKPVKLEVNVHKNRKNTGDMDAEEEKPSGLYVLSSRLPLVLSDRVQRSKALVECEGDSIDLSGDVGAVGRIVVADDSSGNHEMLLDLKGTIYRTNIVPSRTFCVVSFGQSEAKIEALMNDFIQLKPQSNVYEAETMVEGTLEGFSFDSEDEVDDLPKAMVNNQNEDAEEQPNAKTKKKAEKASGAGRKKVKNTGGKLPKKAKKKSQAPKKSKSKKLSKYSMCIYLD